MPARSGGTQSPWKSDPFVTIKLCAAAIFRNRSVKRTALSVRQPIERLEEAAARIGAGNIGRNDNDFYYSPEKEGKGAD